MTPPTVQLTSGDVSLLDAPPVLALLRLEREVPSAAVRAAVLRHVPVRLRATVDADDERLVLDPDRAPAFAARDVEPRELDGLLRAGTPVRELARIGLGTAPARDPLLTAVHLRVAGGDALAVRLSHAGGDGMTLVRLLDAIVRDLAATPDRVRSTRAPGDRARSIATPASDDDGDPSLGTTPGPAEERVLSVLPLGPGCRAELDAVAEDRPDLSATMRRMAVLARRIAPLVRPPEEGLRVRIPVDLRHRGLGIPADAPGNQWFDALAVLDGPLGELPPAGTLAEVLTDAVRSAAETIRPDDVDHRADRSLVLRRAVPTVPIRRGVDLVHSALPVPAWPGVRELLVLGSASLGVADVRGADRVALVTPGPLRRTASEL